MKQIRFKHLATLGFCCSLFSYSLAGVTAVAETMTIESSPTAEINEKNEDKKESKNRKTQVTETSEEPFQKNAAIPEQQDQPIAAEGPEAVRSEERGISTRKFVWVATATTSRTTVRLGDAVDYRLKFENITTDDIQSDIVGPIKISAKLAAGMTKPTSVTIKVGQEEQNVYLGEGTGNANSGGEYFTWNASTRTLYVVINRLHGRNSGQTGYIKTLYFRSSITGGSHGEIKFVDTNIDYYSFAPVNRRNNMTYVDKFAGNLALKGNFQFYNEHGSVSTEQMSLSMNSLLFKSTGGRVETSGRYPLTMTNEGNGLYNFNTGFKLIGSSNGGSWLFYSNDTAATFTTTTTNRIDKIVLAPPKATLPDSRQGIMTTRAYTATTSTKSNYDLSLYNFTKSTDKIWRLPNAHTNTGVATNIVFSDNMSGVNGQFNTGNYNNTVNYYIYYKKLKEHFVDGSGNPINPPTGFTEGKITTLKTEDYTFTQSGNLPESYTDKNGKKYTFKGWYKGKTKPATLKTGKPTYKTTYDGNDDLTVVYDEGEVVNFPALTYQFGFVDEAGSRVDASKINLTYDNWVGELLTQNVADWKTVSLEKGQVALTKNNLKEIVYPSHTTERLSGRTSQFSAANLTFTPPRYYEKMSIYNKNGTFDTAYPLPNIQDNNSTSPIVDDSAKNVSRWFELTKSGGQSFVLKLTTSAAPADMRVPGYLREIVYNPVIASSKMAYYTIDKPFYYHLTNRKVTENFIDPAGNKLASVPTDFKQGQQTAITTDPYMYTSAKALPDTYKGADGKTYKFKGWYKGTDKTKIQTTKTPSYKVTFDDNDDLNVVYEEAVTKASVTLARITAETVANNGNVTWTAKLTNTGQAELSDALIKKSAAWSTGLTAPTSMVVTVAGGTAKTVPVTATTWTNGVSLGSAIPVGQSATIRFTTKASGTANQVLKAAITTSGNYSAVSAAATVRIKDNDQDVTTPVADGFISTPTFDFGQVNISSNTQQHSLKKAADYYNNGARNPYLRIKKTQPNWSLTAQLSQPKSTKDSLPTATRLLLGATPVSRFSNYNQPAELKNAVGTTNAISLTANNTDTSIISSKQFTGSDIYQLDFNFNNVKLEVPANQGTKGEQYNATVTWNLVTGP